MRRFFPRLVQQLFLLPVVLLVGAVGPTVARAAQLTLTWTDASMNEDGFKIERKTGDTGTFAQVATRGADVTSYVDSNLPFGTKYCYRLVAYNAGGDSPYSGEACGTTTTQPFTLTVTKTGNGTVNSTPAGIACGADCSESYASATSVTLSAIPATGSTFSGWSNGGCSGTGTCTLLLNASTTVAATFTATPQSYTLTVTKAGSGSGTVNSSPAGITCGADCSESYASSTAVTLSATPASGSSFSGWSGGCSGTGTCTVTLSAATTSVTATFTPVSSTNPTGLIAAYSFNAGSGATVADTSGNANTGTISGAAWTTQGKFGAALSFNGVNAWVTIPDAPALDLTTGMTMEAWVYPTVAPSGWRTILVKEQPGEVVYFLHASSSSNQPATGVYIGGGEKNLLGGTRLTANTWRHLAATYDGATQRLYVNGVQVASRAQTGTLQTSASPLRIGGNSIWGEYFQGRIDEVRVYKRALSAGEIQTDMTTPVTP